jgi:hypothetical protein
MDIEQEYRSGEHDCLCLRPMGVLDLMLYGRRHKELQLLMKQKPIVLRKVSVHIVEPLLAELDKRIELPSILFANSGKVWKVKRLHKGTGKEIAPDQKNAVPDEDFVNLVLNFSPNKGLKSLAKNLLGMDDVITFEEQFKGLKKPKEYSWDPWSSVWVDCISSHLQHWTNNKVARRYAEDDVTMTYRLFQYFFQSQSDLDLPVVNNCFNDPDSVLAFHIGNVHLRGYGVDVPRAKMLYTKRARLIARGRRLVQFTSPKKCLAYLHEVASPIEKAMVKGSDGETLKLLKCTGNPDLARRANLIIKMRKWSSENTLLAKLIQVGKMHVTFKVTGTKSNRMSGGSIEGRNGSINPQGIPKGPIRKVVTFRLGDEELSSGDFDGFEVSIAEAEYHDVNLRKDLLTGKKIHGLWGMSLFKLTYEAIVAMKTLYDKAKTSFFARLYGAQEGKLAQVTGLTIDQVRQASKDFGERYPGVKESQDKVIREHTAMSQVNGIGTAIEWVEPKLYVESFLGFRRFFTLEYKVMKALFDLAQELPISLSSINICIKRRDRIQTVSGALQSALFAAAFGLQSAIMRQANNHKIQSPGGEITKELQFRLVDTFQPKGIHKFYISPMNIHDEEQVPHVPEIRQQVTDLVNNFIKEKSEQVPLISMCFKNNLNNWGDK